MRRTVSGYSRIATILAAAAALGLCCGCGTGGGGTNGGSAATGKSQSGSPTTNVVQAATIDHVTVGDISVGYRVIGPLAGAAAAEATGTSKTRPLLLIMGSSGTMDLWSPEFVEALAQDRQVIVFDNRGIGSTDNPKGAYPFSQLADDTAGLIKALGYERLDVLGWSMGGDVAIDLAVRHPAVVSRLVSYAGSAGGPAAVPPTAQALAVLTDTSGTPEERGQKLLELLFAQEYRTAHPDYLRAFPIPTEQAQPTAIGLQNAAIGEWKGVADGLKSIKAASLFVNGTEDVMTPPQNAVVMADLVPGSWLMRFAGAGHGLMYQDPKGLAESVLLFLSVTTE